MRLFTVLVLALGSFAIAGLVHAADVPGSKDPPDFKRYEGPQIIHYQSRSFDRYVMARDNSFARTETAESAPGGAYCILIASNGDKAGPAKNRRVGLSKI